MPYSLGDAAPSTAPPLIQVDRLVRSIETRAQRTIILDDVTFTIPAHSLFAINGPSGSGKSTLLNMLTGIDRPTSGKVVFAGQELRAHGENALAARRTNEASYTGETSGGLDTSERVPWASRRATSIQYWGQAEKSSRQALAVAASAGNTLSIRNSSSITS